MASDFEIWMHGCDAVNLEAAGEQALDEVTRLEQLMSRHDPAAELHRINSLSGAKPVLTEPEMIRILKRCLEWHELTNGIFDIAVLSGSGSLPDVLRVEGQRVSFTSPEAWLDLGGFGKGYALDAAAQVLKRFGVRNALLNGGTSSVLALGNDPSGDPWSVGLRSPNADPHEPESAEVVLTDQAMSSSATFSKGEVSSDTFDPRTGEPLSDLRACTVITGSAADAEALSTAFAVAGKDGADEMMANLRVRYSGSFQLAWIDAEPGLVWMGEDNV
jgi:thiamine biosynthesis lipoprotein